ncbi:MAG: polysaccharide lyase [Planctomycetota bacterium]|nr:polysaccharide lyase [Planctomycetota bacterium]
MLQNLALACAVLMAAGWAAAQDGTPPAAVQGLAAGFPLDQGIESHPAVIFTDDFEGWPGDGTQAPKSKWHGMIKNKTTRTRLVEGRVERNGFAGPGAKVLEQAAWSNGGESQTAGLQRKLGNYNRDEGLGEGLDEVYVRYYVKFSANYENVRNHGINLGGRDLTRGDARWVGMANTMDVASQGYFFSGLQPYAKGPGLEFGFYSYHCDKPNQWGDVRKGGDFQPGRWYCVERRMKLNSAPDRKDGFEQLWLDGKQVIDWQGVRFRKVMNLRITLLSFETYYHGLPAKFQESNPLILYFDHVVAAKAYIGPLAAQASPPRAVAPPAPDARSAPARPALDPAPWRAKLREELARGATGWPVTMQLVVMGKRERVTVTGAGAKGPQVRLRDNMLPLAWADLTDEDLAQLAAVARPDGGETLYAATMLAYACEQTALYERLAMQLARVDATRAAALERELRGKAER